VAQLPKGTVGRFLRARILAEINQVTKGILNFLWPSSSL
jgi:hypothetical protein